MSIVPVKKTTKKKQYFTQETEDAIILYNKTENSNEKSRIYEEKIHYAFYKLTENIIHTFKFYHTEVDNIEDLQHEIMIFLLGKLPLYNHRKSVEDRFKKIITKEFKEKYESNFEEYVGEVDRVTQEQINAFLNSLTVSVLCREKLSKITPPKAYSYFGTIVKRWLILNNTKNYKKKVDKLPLDELEQNEEHSNDIGLVDESKDQLSIFIDKYVKYCDENLTKLFIDENEVKIADAILELFRKREYLSIFNKKALYINIREIIDVKTPKITKIADELYDIFKKHYSFYRENGYTKFNS